VLVVIVIAPNADNTGPDLDRIGKVEDIPDEIARTMLDLGTARKPTGVELATHRGEARSDDGTPELTEAAPPAKSAPRPPSATGRPPQGEPSAAAE
jgi:hypothetical protein